MYKAAVRWLIRRNIGLLNDGKYQPTLAMFAPDATLAFPGDNSWARMYREPEKSQEQFVTHRGLAEIEAFLQRFVDQGITMHVDAILVNGPPWNTPPLASTMRSSTRRATRSTPIVRSSWSVPSGARSVSKRTTKTPNASPRSIATW